MLLPVLFFLSVVNDVRTLIARHDLAAAEQATRAYQAQAGTTPDLAAAISWIARGALEAKNYDLAEKRSADARKMTLDLMHGRALDSNPWLPMALGASIEVHAQVLAARGERAEAVAFLRHELATYGATSIGERIGKNINLLTLEGKPAPALESPDFLESRPPSMTALRGHPVLLFFWAHWCGDCKQEESVIASVMRNFGPKGLKLIAPSRLYGYVAGGEEAPPAMERQYIARVRQQFYPSFAGVPIPISAQNFVTYGASSTPTVVLVDAKGIVRFYHPGAVTETELSSRVQKVLAN